MARLAPLDPSPTRTQTVAVGIRLGGPHRVVVDAHGENAKHGSYISVTAEGAVVYVYDPRAAASYANAWIDAVVRIGTEHLPEAIEPTATERRAHEDSPAVVIRAHGHDEVQHFTAPATDRQRLAVAIRIGQVTWLVQDRAAYRAYTAAWRQAKQLAPIVLGRGFGNGL